MRKEILHLVGVILAKTIFLVNVIDILFFLDKLYLDLLYKGEEDEKK
jgi:hypothetical protein